MGCEAKPLNDDDGVWGLLRTRADDKEGKIKIALQGISQVAQAPARWSTLMRTDGRRFDCLNTAQRLR